MPSSYATGIVHYRLGQIQARILQDYVGANKSYESALESKPNQNLINKIDLQIGEMLLLSGSFIEAEKYYDTLKIIMKKRLYRNKKDSKIAGICSGLGDYFKVDPIIIRLIFIF